MRIVTWNVNSIRTRIDHVTQLIKEHKPSVIALQEIKTGISTYPHKSFTFASIVNGQPAYNGVSIHTRADHNSVEIDPIQPNLGSRVVACTYKNIRFINVYVPNGGKDDEAYVAKLQWLASLMEYMYVQQRTYKNIIVLGDFNICPSDKDVYDPKAWKDSITCTEAERAFYWSMTHSGFHDAWLVKEKGERYTWWDYRNNSFDKNHGLRIDLMLVSDNMRQYITACDVLTDYRSKERPSDHAPLILTIEK